MDETIQNRVLTYFDVLMRVPLLFVIDELLRVGLGTADDAAALNATDTGIGGCRVLHAPIPAHYDITIPNISQEPFFVPRFNIDCYFNENYFLTTIKVVACFVGCLAALCIFVLSTKHLVLVYLHLISIGVVFVSYWSNVTTIKHVVTFLSTPESPPSILDDILGLNFSWMSHGPGFLILQNYILQCLLASIFCYIHLAPKYAIVQKLLVLSFLAPSVLGITLVPSALLHHAPVFATLLPLLVCKFVIWCHSLLMMMALYTGYKHARNYIENYGMSALAEREWRRLNVPTVLRAFWMLRVFEQVIQILANNYSDETLSYYQMLRTLLVNGSETLTALLGMTSIISYICHYIGRFSLWVLMSEDDDEKNIGTISAILFYILALQTGLTSLDREKRLVRLYRNFCLLFAALLHFVHNIVNPLLMSLSASHNPALHRHLRALAVCAVLIIFPVTLLVFLWSHFTISTWLLAVSVFSVEVIVKVFVSLAIYSLFLFDAYRSVFWEQLDDCVYMIRSFGNTVEFSFGIVLFFNGFWILIFESGGAVRAIMMCIHAYFNIWCEATAGWNVFMKRRTAVNKINSLPEAKVEQLRMHDDVCAICYQEMRSAKVTRCNHYFHGVCLRKWLYIQDRCPLCHDILHKVPDNNRGDVAATGSQSDVDLSRGNAPVLPAN